MFKTLEPQESLIVQKKAFPRLFYVYQTWNNISVYCSLDELIQCEDSYTGMYV